MITRQLMLLGAFICCFIRVEPALTQSSADEASAEKWKLKKIISPKQYTKMDQGMCLIAQSAARACEKKMKEAFDRNLLSETDLFCELYFPRQPLTSPRTFSTFYDGYTDSALTMIEDHYLASSPHLIYAAFVDRNGYLPSHNSKFAQPPTGNLEIDFLYSRSKRIYNDLAGYISGRNTDPSILQVYYRDTGEKVADMSAPVYINGRHWGSFRVGYRKEN